MTKKKEWPPFSEHVWVTLVISISIVSAVLPSGAKSVPDMKMSLCNGTDCRNKNGMTCTNEDGWNLRGSDWGCCGNYEGCCTYASLICYLHDAMCKCCDIGNNFCGPKCKPESYCVNAFTQQHVPYKKDNEYLKDQPSLPETNGQKTDQVISNSTEGDNDMLNDTTKIHAENVQYDGIEGGTTESMQTTQSQADSVEGSGETDERVIL